MKIFLVQVQAGAAFNSLLVICKSYFAPVEEVPWDLHTEHLCATRKREVQTRELIRICPKHLRAQAPALLLGGICPLCQPNLSLRAINPDILRNIKNTDVKKPDTIPIYNITNEYKIC